MNVQARTTWMPNEVFIADAIPEDERLWVQTRKNSWFRPLLLSVSQGFWVTVARFAADGVVSRHSHPQAVHGYVLKGRWRYLEHDWLAQPGSYVYEAPGETHTLVVDGSAGEMVTIFQVFGAIVYHDENGVLQRHDDVFTRVEQCRKHFEQCGLGADYVARFVR